MELVAQAGRLIEAIPNELSRQTLNEELAKIGAKVVVHSRYVFFQMAEVAVPRKLFAAILDRIQRLRTVASMAPS